ncbi:MAG: family 78 glycoside hydrolase catalytic domain [Phycisphaerales bacterium]|nr:MAG: family 78 glycoside hydrolase catalytic domain [Phycisphaerales bacterium]
MPLVVLCFICFLSISSGAEDHPAIPDRLVVLTFDDGCKSHSTFVAPLLKRYGFGATFFISEAFMANKQDYMSWEDVRGLHEAGFEIGNHARRHLNFSVRSRREFLADVEYMERRCKEHGIAAPKTFCYPGYHVNGDISEALSEKGYLCARRGCESLSAFSGYQEGGRGPAYDPARHHKLLIPTTGAAGPKWTFEDFLWAVKQARDGKIAVLTFHGVPDRHRHCSTEPELFEKCMGYLHDNDYTVVAMRELARYADLTGNSADLLDQSRKIEQSQMGAGVTPADLRCEYSINPLGIDVAQPRLSWILRSGARGQMQSAYQILVAGSRENLRQNKGELWDSGKVKSDRSVNVAYKGRALKSAQRCYWKVRCWDKDDNPSRWSYAAAFEMGLLKEADWQGKWVGADWSISAPLLRKEFEIGRKIKSARVYISGLGWYEFYINDQRVGDHVLDPATTNYHKRILYVTYDVTSLLKDGTNAIGVMLGNGWYSERSIYKHRFLRLGKRTERKRPECCLKYGDSPRVLLQMNVEFMDGKTMSVKTNSDWKVSSGPITRNDLYGGETYDARLEKPGWTRGGYNDAGWQTAELKNSPGGRLVSQTMPPIKVQKTIVPVSCKNPKPGVYVYDMGQLFGGWTRLFATGAKGTKITIKYSAHISDETGLVDKRHYPEPEETDYYFLRGDAEGEVYEPRFTYHPVRYVQIEGYPGEPTINDLQGRVVYSAVELAGNFHCSNTLINRVHRNVLWTLTNELMGIPLDCLHAEHWAWTDPATVTGTLYTRKHMPMFWTKWLNDIKDEQHENGAIPEIAPSYAHSQVTPSFGGNYPILVWYIHQCYDDYRILEEHYPAMKKWVDYLTYSASDNYIVTKGRWGDHMLPGEAPGKEQVRPTETPPELLWTGYYYRNASIASQAAALLGKPDDAEYYSSLAENIKDALNRKWLDPNTSQYAAGTQTANLLPLALGIVPATSKERVEENIVENIMTKYGGHLHTGNTGTGAMIEALGEHGYADIMYKVATTTTYPGWGYMIKQGATVIWQGWGKDKELSMIMWCTIAEFFYSDLAGLKAPDYYGPSYMAPGYRRITIKPQVVGDLKHTKASVKTVRGLVGVDWRKDENSFEMKVTIPVNSKARVHVPKIGFEDVVITEGSRTVWKAGRFIKSVEGISDATGTSNYVAFDVGSGNYSFLLSLPRSSQAVRNK